MANEERSGGNDQSLARTGLAMLSELASDRPLLMLSHMSSACDVTKGCIARVLGKDWVDYEALLRGVWSRPR